MRSCLLVLSVFALLLLGGAATAQVLQHDCSVQPTSTVFSPGAPTYTFVSSPTQSIVTTSHTIPPGAPSYTVLPPSTQTTSVITTTEDTRRTRRFGGFLGRRRDSRWSNESATYVSRPATTPVSYGFSNSMAVNSPGFVQSAPIVSTTNVPSIVSAPAATSTTTTTMTTTPVQAPAPAVVQSITTTPQVATVLPTTTPTSVIATPYAPVTREVTTTTTSTRTRTGLFSRLGRRR